LRLESWYPLNNPNAIIILAGVSNDMNTVTLLLDPNGNMG